MEIGAPPAADGAGYSNCGPLLVRSVATTNCKPAPVVTAPAAAARHATDVAQAWLIIGPLTAPAPSRAASVGAP